MKERAQSPDKSEQKPVNPQIINVSVMIVDEIAAFYSRESGEWEAVFKCPDICAAHKGSRIKNRDDIGRMFWNEFQFCFPGG